MRKAQQLPPKFFTARVVEGRESEAILEITITGADSATSMLFHGQQIDDLAALLQRQADRVRRHNERHS